MKINLYSNIISRQQFSCIIVWSAIIDLTPWIKKPGKVGFYMLHSKKFAWEQTCNHGNTKLMKKEC